MKVKTFDHFENNKEGELSCDQVPASLLVEKFGSPLYVYSKKALLGPLLRLKTGLKDLNVTLCFAVKANSNIHVLKTLADAGAGMDLVSEGELRRALQASVTPSKIVFSGVGKTESEIRTALSHSIASFNVESEPELLLLSKVAMEMKLIAPAVLRFNPDVNAKTHPYISTGLKKNKFGLEKKEILDLCKNAARYPGVRIQGISIHIGSQLTSLAPLDDAFLRLKDLVKRIEENTSVKLTTLDLGGGVGIRYQNENPPSIEKYCKLILKHFGPRTEYAKRFRFFLEPGRLIAGNAGVLLTRILYKKNRGSRNFLIVDAAMNDLLRPALYGSFHAIGAVRSGNSKSKKIEKFDVVGPVCETSDCFATGRAISGSTEEGDLLAIFSVGAYGFSMSGNYNSRPRPAEVLIEESGARLIRKRETFTDLIRGELES